MDDIKYVIYASNDGYAPHLAASMVSLLENNRKIPKLKIWLLSAGMCDAYKERLGKIARRYGQMFEAVELGDLRARFPYEVDTRGFDISAMARLFAPQVLPEEVTRALYLDCDTIVCGDISPLFALDLGENVVGMVMEPTVYGQMKASIGLKKDDPYYNSGVLLMDLDAWRREAILDKLLDYYGARGANLFACDQDTLNGALFGQILPLSPRYNFFTNYRYFRYATLESLCAAYRAVGKAEFERAKHFPVVIHYLGDERPWIRGSRNHYRKLYDHYLGKTPWKNMERQRGKELYMAFWWILNHATLICPSFRLWISRGFGMKVIDARKRKK